MTLDLIVIKALNKLGKDVKDPTDVIPLPTGDGIVLSFFKNAIDPLHCALKVAEFIKHDGSLNLRMGLHVGPVYILPSDIRGHQNIAGDGINDAQRVMDLGSTNHILASEFIVNLLRNISSDYERLFHDLGVYKVKHDREMRIHSIWNDKIGNKYKTPSPEKRGEGTTLIYIPEGPFIMGNDDIEDETPKRSVVIKSYWIGKCPVTNQQYAVFLQETGYREPSFWHDSHFNNPLEPVIGVSWDDAKEYCNWLTQKTSNKYRLPTEAEWEKAARGEDGRMYPWGNNWNALKANSFEAGAGKTTAVNAYGDREAESIYGCLDMAGNVWEWCADWYHPRYYKDARTENPEGPKEGIHKVVRGGAWNTPLDSVKCSARGSLNSQSLNNNVGFRYVREL